MADATSPTKKPAPPATKVAVTYNGRIKEFHYKKKELVGELLKKAVEAFGIVQNAHLLSLFDSAGHELNEALSLADAGVEPGDELVLRQSVVKGG